MSKTKKPTTLIYPAGLSQQVCVETVIEALRSSYNELRKTWEDLYDRGAPAEKPNLAPELAALFLSFRDIEDHILELEGNEAVRCRKLGIPSRYRLDQPEPAKRRAYRKH